MWKKDFAVDVVGTARCAVSCEHTAGTTHPMCRVTGSRLGGYGYNHINHFPFR